MVRRLIALACVAGLSAAAPAAAQIPTPTPTPTPTPSPTPTPRPSPTPTPSPTPAPDAPPVSVPPPPGPDFTTAEGDPAHRRWTVDPGLTPPFAFAWKAQLPGAVGMVLAAEGRVFVTQGTDSSSELPTGVVAYEAATGRHLWTSVQAAGSAPRIAYAAGRLVVSSGEALQGLDPATGAPAWTMAGRGGSGLTAVGGEVIMVAAASDSSSSSSSDSSTVLRSVDAATGAVRWSRPLTNESTDPVGPAVSGDRVFRTDECGTHAHDRRDGTRIYTRNYGCSYSFGTVLPGRLTGGQIIAGTRVIDAGNGTLTGTFPTPTDSLADNIALVQSGESELAGVDLGGRKLWAVRSNGGSQPRGLSLNDAAFVVEGTTAFKLLDRATGAVRWSAARVTEEDEATAADHDLVVAPVAGAGVIVVPSGSEVFVLAPAARAPTPELRVKAVKQVVPFGSRFVVKGHVGTELGQQAPLSVDRAGFGRRRFKAGEPGATGPDGSFSFRSRPTRFTRYRFRSPSAAGSKTVAAFVTPRFGATVRPARPGSRTVTVRVRVRVPRGVRAGGRILGLYIAEQAKSRRYTRLALTRLGGRRGGVYRGTLRYRVRTSFDSSDVFVYCVSGLVRQGLGIGDRLDRRCGRRRVKA